jgi:uncharacterized protein YbjT (DUF2867 family)
MAEELRAQEASFVDATAKRTALLVGGTGLVGRALLSLLLASEPYRQVHLLVRRELPSLTPSTKLTVHHVDLAQLSGFALPAADDVFIALGTTIKVAGSESAFRQVDYDYVVSAARAGLASGARRLAVVSAMGADPKSRVFYNRVKGEMEAVVAQLGYETVVIAQPSLLLGDRGALGQPARRAEALATRLVAPMSWLVPKSVRPIHAQDVAAAMVAAVLTAGPGVHRLASGAMQGRSCRP